MRRAGACTGPARSPARTPWRSRRGSPGPGAGPARPATPGGSFGRPPAACHAHRPRPNRPGTGRERRGRATTAGRPRRPGRRRARPARSPRSGTDVGKNCSSVSIGCWRSTQRVPTTGTPNPQFRNRCRIPQTRTSAATTTAANRVGSTNGSPAATTTPSPASASDQFRPPQTRSSCEIRTSRATASLWSRTARSQHPASGSVSASAAAAAARARGERLTPGRGAAVSGRRDTRARPGRVAPGSPSGQDASTASSRNAAPAGSTSAARRSPCRDSTPLAHALAPRLDATRSAQVAHGIAYRRLACPDPADREDRGERDRDRQRPAGNQPARRRLAAPGGRTPSSIMVHLARGSEKATTGFPEIDGRRRQARPPTRRVSRQGVLASPGHPVARDRGGPASPVSSDFSKSQLKYIFCRTRGKRGVQAG